MADKTAGNAGVQIHPDFEKFIGELRTYLESVDASLGVEITVDTAGADAQLAKWREENERNIRVGVDADTAKAKASLDELSRARIANVEAHTQGVEERRAQLDELAKARIAEVQARTEGIEERRAQLDELARTRLAIIRAQVDKASTATAKKDLAEFTSAAKEAGTLNLKVLGVVGAAGAVSDLLAIVDAASQASRALALLPAAGGALLAGGAAAAIGASGISAVFKDYTAASQDAIGNTTKRTDTLNALAEAQYSVGQAQRAQQTADRGLLQDEKDLNTAYQDSSRSLRDMNLSLKEQSLNVSDTAIAVNEAAKNLQQVQFDPTADADARQKAVNDYQESIIRNQQAQNKQNDLTADTAQANALGVAGSRKVVDAQQKVADGINAEADAAHGLQQALVGVQKAQQQVTEASGQSKIDTALAKLSPNAKELVQDVRSLGPAWTDTRIAAQDALTNGMGPAVEKFAGVQLPVFKKGIVDIDTALNTGLRSTLAELSTQASKTDLATFLGNTTAAFTNAAGGAAPFTQAITTLGTAGSVYLPQMGQAVDNVATKFDNLILRTSSNGQLQAWLRQGVTSAEEFAQTAEHIGSAFLSVFRAANSSGDVLKSLDDVTGKMATFLKSAQGQSDLGRIFSEAKAEGEKFIPVLKDLPGLLQGVSQGTKLWADITMPFLRAAADLLAANPHLVELAVAAYAGFKTVKPILDGAGLAVDLLAKKGDAAAAKAGGIGKFKAAGSELLTLMGSPWVSGLAIAAAGVGTFVDSVDKGSSAVQRFKTQAQQAIDANATLQKALQSSGGTLDAGVLDAETAGVKGLRDALAANAADMPGIADKAQQGLTGISSGLLGLGTGVLNNDQIRQSTDQASKAVADAFNNAGLSNDQLAQKITGDKPAFDALLNQLSGMGDGGREAAAKLQGLRDEWAIDTTAVTPVASAIKDLGDKNKDAATSIDAATSAMERQRQNGLTLEDATLKVNSALSAMGNSAQTAGGAVITAAGAIDTTSTKGQQLYQLLNQQLVPAWEGETSAAYRNAIQHGQTAQQATQAAQQTSDAIKTSAEHSIESMGYTQAQADALLAHYQPLAKNFGATFTADTTQAQSAIDQLQAKLDLVFRTEGSIPTALQPYAAELGLGSQYHQGLPSTQSLPGAPSPVPPWLSGVVGHKTGGQLRGPGTGTSDSMIIRASNKEYLSREASVDKYGVGFYDALNAGVIDPKALPAYATGGLIGSTPGTTSVPGASRIPILIQDAQALAGQPYGGPLDCSGLISQLALDAAGLPPTSGRMSTATEGPWLGALGWTLGNGGGTGVFSVGWINDPSMPGGGHTAGTLPDGNNIEASGSANKVLYGPTALGSNANLFTQHAYLNMSSATVNTANGGLGAPEAGTLATPTPGVTSTPVLNPQVGAPAPLSDQQLTVMQDRAAFDSANSQRNAVYADPKSTQQDKTAADYAYSKAANTLGSAMQAQSSGTATLFSAQGAGTALGIGIGSVIGAAIGASIPGGQGAAVNAGVGGSFGNKFGGKLGGILAGGLLNSLGLGGSVLSEGNAWNAAFQQGIAASGTAFGTGGLGAYGYIPKNLPSIVTTTTPQATPTDPGTASYAGTGTAAPTAANAAAVHTYDPAGGSQQWLGTVQQILQATGRNVADASETVSQIGIESSGNPNAENDTPDGIAAGTPIGLLQVIKTTFDANADPRFPGDQRTPSANIAAALNYVDHRYGGPSHIWPTAAGYADGGWLDGEGGPRTDSIPMLWWGSNGERLHVMNAKSADQNAAVLDAMNAGARFQPLDMPSSFQSRGSDGGDVHHHHGTVNIHDPQIMDMGEFMHRMNQHQAMATLGSMSAWPV